MLDRQTGRAIRHEYTTSLEARMAVAQGVYAHAREHFWQFRLTMNPKLVLRDQWFPKTLAWRLRAFWEDLKAGKRPILLVQTPPQHGKSISVIDFIAWAIGHDPELRVIYSSFSDRPRIRANLRLQRIMNTKQYQAIFPGTYLNDKHAVMIGSYMRNHEGSSSSTTRATSATPLCWDRSLVSRSTSAWLTIRSRVAPRRIASCSVRRFGIG